MRRHPSPSASPPYLLSSHDPGCGCGLDHLHGRRSPSGRASPSVRAVRRRGPACPDVSVRSPPPPHAVVPPRRRRDRSTASPTTLACRKRNDRNGWHVDFRYETSDPLLGRRKKSSVCCLPRGRASFPYCSLFRPEFWSEPLNPSYRWTLCVVSRLPCEVSSDAICLLLARESRRVAVRARMRARVSQNERMSENEAAHGRGSYGPASEVFSERKSAVEKEQE